MYQLYIRVYKMPQYNNKILYRVHSGACSQLQSSGTVMGKSLECGEVNRGHRMLQSASCIAHSWEAWLSLDHSSATHWMHAPCEVTSLEFELETNLKPVRTITGTSGMLTLVGGGRNLQHIANTVSTWHLTVK